VWNVHAHQARNPARSGHALVSVTTAWVSRRDFLIRSGVFVCGVGFALEGCGRSVSGQRRSDPLTVNAWVTLYPDETIEIVTPGIELGQGAMTAMPRFLAEELDADWSKVRVVPAPSDEKQYGNPLFWNMQLTAGSRTALGYFDVLRLAGAQARYILLTTAARQWEVPLGELETSNSIVKHAVTGRTIRYGELVPTAQVPKQFPEFVAPDDQPQLTDDFFGDAPKSILAPGPTKSRAIRLKSRNQYKLIGSDTPRLDIPAKVCGAARYGIDVSLPGMLYAVVETGPVQGSVPDTVDDSSARAVPGIVDIVRLPYGVAVVARGFFAARSGRERLKVTWRSSAPSTAYDSTAIRHEFSQIAANSEDNPGVRVFEKGDPKATASALKSSLERTAGDRGHPQHGLTFETHSELVYHAPIEPQNATLRIAEDGKSAEAWVGTQWPKLDQDFVSRVLGIKPEAVKIYTQLVGGSFGRRQEPGAIVDAAHIAKQLRKPIKVIWTREDDIKRNPFRQALTCRIEAAVGAGGQVHAMRHRVVADSWFARVFLDFFQLYHQSDPGNWVGALSNYDVPLQSVDSVVARRGIDVCYMRGVGVTQTKFAQECMVDRIAAAQHMDPLDFRLHLLRGSPRGVAVLKIVQQMADWNRKRAGRALGLAFTPYSNSFAALIAEVSVDRGSGTIRVHEIWCAVDVGLAAQPAMVVAQMEGGILQGMSMALYEQVTIKNGVVQESNFHQYQMLRMSQTPEVHVRVLSTDNALTGAGEIGVMQIAPAINNAVARLIGKHLTRMPMLPEDVQHALRG
jgi:isoquinoline 1-oxidoreductase subunit beta